MSEELKNTGDLLDGLAAQPPQPMGKITGSIGVRVDSGGIEFNPEIHKADENGNPVIGSVKQFLLKKEAKKSALRRAADKISEIWNGEKSEISEISEVSNFPPSDHEVNEIQAEKPDFEFSAQGRKPALLSTSAENSADLFFVGGSMLVGIEFLNQRTNFHPKTAEIIAEYERRTGKQMDLPPGVALALGLGRIGYEIIQREPACKAKFETGVRAIRENAGKYIRSKIPGIGRSQKTESPAAGVTNAA